ncbi:hypothetical protein AbraIFM66950_002938, partial [Aspergillus brasiliensis]
MIETRSGSLPTRTTAMKLSSHSSCRGTDMGHDIITMRPTNNPSGCLFLEAMSGLSSWTSLQERTSMISEIGLPITSAGVSEHSLRPCWS